VKKFAHDTRWAMHRVYFPVCDPVFDEKKSDVDVSGSLPGRRPTVSFHLHSTHVILVKLATVNLASLCLDPSLCVINSDRVAMCRSIDLGSSSGIMFFFVRLPLFSIKILA
jgi:hypothetical protein